MLAITVFVSADPPEGDDARAVKVVKAVAERFPGQITCEVLPLSGERAADLGLSVGPAVMEGDMVLCVGSDLSAGRLKRYMEARLAEL